MKLLAILASAFLAIDAATDSELWANFKIKHGKGFRSLSDEQKRFSIFQDNLRKIEAHNEKYQKGEKSYHMGVTPFADLTREEYLSMFNTTAIDASELRPAPVDLIMAAAAPDEIDWRTKGVVSEIKSQGNCGGCWAFSATGAIESHYAIKTGKLLSLSEQNLIDCSTTIGNHGCSGGTIHRAFSYSAQYGVETEVDYPYLARDATCHYEATKKAVKLSTYATVKQGSEAALKTVVGTIGPVSVSINADYFQFYTGGLFDEPSCTTTVTHGVLIVGYGTTEDGTAYWQVKNSWGDDWGEDGYIRMAKDKNGQCGIDLYGVYPVV